MTELEEKLPRERGDELADPVDQLLLDLRIGAEEAADHEERQDEQRDDR